MRKTSRRSLLKGTAVAGASAALGLAIKPERHVAGEESHKHQPIAGPLATAIVSFGQWPTDPPLSRFPNLGGGPGGVPNNHQLIPNEVKIKAGGSVNFIIGGFHQVLVYDDGTQPGDINPNLTVPAFPGGPPLINDPDNRIYRGVNPFGLPQDRVEVVHFSNPGDYLVICGVRPHFVNDDMFGFVRVLP